MSNLATSAPALLHSSSMHMHTHQQQTDRQVQDSIYSLSKRS